MNNKQICESKGKDFHKETKRCVKKCKAGQNRNQTFKCSPINKITKTICESKNKDFNRFTKKCIKKCDIDKKRHFYCPTKTKDIHFYKGNLSRKHPCDQSKFGNLTKQELYKYHKYLGKSPHTKSLGKNYGTICRPKCNSLFSKYNKDTNRCRHTSLWFEAKKASK